MGRFVLEEIEGQPQLRLRKVFAPVEDGPHFVGRAAQRPGQPDFFHRGDERTGESRPTPRPDRPCIALSCAHHAPELQANRVGGQTGEFFSEGCPVQRFGEVEIEGEGSIEAGGKNGGEGHGNRFMPAPP